MLCSSLIGREVSSIGEEITVHLQRGKDAALCVWIESLGKGNVLCKGPKRSASDLIVARDTLQKLSLDMIIREMGSPAVCMVDNQNLAEMNEGF